MIPLAFNLRKDLYPDGVVSNNNRVIVENGGGYLTTDWTGAPDDWTNYSVGTVSVITGIGFTGNAVKLSITPPSTSFVACGIYQYLPLIAGRKYTLSFKWAGFDAVGNQIRIYATTGSPGGLGLNIWSNIASSSEPTAISDSVTFTATSTGSLMLYIQSNVEAVESWVAFDELNLTELPVIAEYTFEGDANDDSGNGYNGTVFGAALTTGRYGVVNNAYLFDASDYIEAPYTRTLTDAISIRARVFVNSSHNGDILNELDGVTYQTGERLLGIRGTDLYLITRRAGTSTVDFIYCSISAYTGKWIDIIADSTGVIYVNNQIQSTISGTTTATYSAIAKTVFALIGNSVLKNTTFRFDNVIDLVKIMKRELTIAEKRAEFRKYPK